MNEEENGMTEGKIYQQLGKIMAAAKAIGKDSENRQQGFNFRGIDAVMNHLHPLFAKHGVVVLPEVLSERSEERITKKYKDNSGNEKGGTTLIYRILEIRFRFVADDGSVATSTVIGEGMDSGDKAANKAMAVGLKYALTQMLLLPYDEIDPDAESHPPSEPKASKQASKPASKAKQDGDKKGYQQLPDCISEKQSKRLWAIAKGANVDGDTLHEHMKDRYGIEHFNEIPWKKYNDICAWAEAGGQDAPDGDEEQGELQQKAQKEDDVPF